MIRPRTVLYSGVFVSGVLAAALYLSEASSQSPTQIAVQALTQPPWAEAQKPPLDPKKLGDPLPRNLFVELSKLVNPAVVSITASTTVRRGPMDPMQQFLEEFYGGRGGRNPFFDGGGRQQLGLGTGFIIREDGLIITNNHVIDRADVINIQLDTNSTKLYEAEVLGRDTRSDIALLKIDAGRKLPVANLGSSKDLQVGEWVAAFGNPYGHAHTMTKGIISAIGREIGELNRFPFIQTDASINPGNSGGPLVNSQGFVIGVNTAVDARAQGIGFAIPIDNVKNIVEQLEKTGRIRRGYIGVGIAGLNPEIAESLGLKSSDGVVVTQIEKGGPAAKGGIQPYDIITEFAGKKTANASDLMNAVGDFEIGKKAKVQITRIQSNKARDLTLDITVGESKAEAPMPGRKQKSYQGQKAPFDLGFKIADYSNEMAADLGIEGEAQGPVVIEVEPRSKAAAAGIRVGDVILDVNRKSVRKATDVVRELRKGSNMMRMARGPIAVIITF